MRVPDTAHEFDLAAVGGGMAGITAAARAGRDGATVVVVERACEIGGSARYASYLWTAPSDQVLADVVEAQAAITFTFGGILVDDQARALNGDGRPIRGLLAAATVFGLRTPETALANRSPVRAEYKER